MGVSQENWTKNYEALKAYVAENGHFPGKHTKLNNWCRYQRKRMKVGTMPEEQRVLFEELADSRSLKVNDLGVFGLKQYKKRK